jgi:hypothetical protein
MRLGTPSTSSLPQRRESKSIKLDRPHCAIVETAERSPELPAERKSRTVIWSIFPYARFRYALSRMPQQPESMIGRADDEADD